ncbi:protein involved in non-classical protein export pathway [Kluyveromyces marxianus]|uniref:Protein involved in non-classical protein export pathway n=1 Tax=Kluyveromyces marxianus TaxID=4911 RepID=A0ABX6EQG0_KLUMA|nr:protein involved in non-classical protein export pathway [Kluyveromyces marxianus]
MTTSAPYLLGRYV